MDAAYGFVVEGLDSVKDIENLDERIIRSARQAINRTLDHSRTAASRRIRAQVSFPAKYLSPGDQRFYVNQRPSQTVLEGRIRAQGRATSLARFALSRSTSMAKRLGGVNVAVHPGSAHFMRGAFLLQLRGANSALDTQANLGLAIRLKPGQTLRNKRLREKQIFPNVYLLYGPSVYQVFETVRQQIAPESAEFLETEFLRISRL